MLCAQQIHIVFFLGNISQTSYSWVPTVEFMWLMEYGWNWWIPFPDLANQISFMWISFSLAVTLELHITDNDVKKMEGAWIPE